MERTGVRFPAGTGVLLHTIWMLWTRLARRENGSVGSSRAPIQTLLLHLVRNDNYSFEIEGVSQP